MMKSALEKEIVAKRNRWRRIGRARENGSSDREGVDRARQRAAAFSKEVEAAVDKQSKRWPTD